MYKFITNIDVVNLFAFWYISEHSDTTQTSYKLIYIQILIYERKGRGKYWPWGVMFFRFAKFASFLSSLVLTPFCSQSEQP